MAHLDVETIGLLAGHHEIVDLGIVYTTVDGEILDRWYRRIQPKQGGPFHTRIAVETESDSRAAQSSTSVSHKSLPHRLLEGLFIIVTVLLGFGVAQFGEYRNNRELARLTTGALCRRPRFDPTARVASVRLLSLTIEDIRTAEAFLLDLYRKHLPISRAAAEAS